jgi:hypothetical protein
MSTHQFETAIEDPNHKLLNTNRTFMLKIPTTFSYRDFFSEYSYIKRKVIVHFNYFWNFRVFSG